MIGPKQCPYCRAATLKGCAHLALAVEGRDFVHACVESSQSQTLWRIVCEQRRRRRFKTGDWSPEQDDFTWLETAFAQEFLQRLTWFGGLDHEWRSHPHTEVGGFWVLLWSKDPQKLWWELRDEFERQIINFGL
jgi:hypothetical protein